MFFFSYFVSKRQTSSSRFTVYVCKQKIADCSEAFDSLAKFLEERKIEFLQKAESHFEVAKESENRYRIIAVVGLFDKGAQFTIKNWNGTK